jgi:hypothetical protein
MQQHKTINMIIDKKISKRIKGVYLVDGKFDGARIATGTKPTLFRRFLTRLFIGWKWVSIEKLIELENK